MSWVRTAVENVKLQGYERLHQTVFGGYGTKPDIFWALDPYDMPEQLRDNVEDTVKEDGSSEATCAIIRLETLPAFDDEELRESGNPLGCFTVYMGTDPSNVEYIRRINIYEEKRPETPPHLKEMTDINGMPLSRLKRLSVNMGWSDPYMMYNKTNNRYSTLGPVPDRESGSMRRRMTLQASWVDRTRRRSSAAQSQENKSGLPSPQGDRRMSSSRRPKRMSMFPSLGNVSETQASSDAKSSTPTPTTPPTVHEIEVASTSSPKPSLEARPSGDGRTRKPRKSRTSSAIRERQSKELGTNAPAPRGTNNNNNNKPTRPATAMGTEKKRESATEAALLALEGKGTAPVVDEGDIPQYLLDAQRGLAPGGLQPPSSSLAASALSASRPASPGRVDAAVRKLKTLSLSAVGRGSPDIRAELGEDFPAARQSPARSLHQRIDAASRKLKTLSMASLGMEISPVREAEPAEPAEPVAKADVTVVAPDSDRQPESEAEASTPPARAEKSSKRRSLFFGAARYQTDSDGEASSITSKLSKLKKNPPTTYPSGEAVVPVDSAVASIASIPTKPQGQGVSRIRDAAEGKRASRLKRFSTHVSRLFN